MSVQTIYGTVQTLADFDGDRSAWIGYLQNMVLGSAREWNQTLWYDDQVPTPDMVVRRDTARKKMDFFAYLQLHAVSGDVQIPTDILIPAALDTPPPPATVQPGGVITSILTPSTTPQQGTPTVQSGGNGRTGMKYRFFIESTTPYHRWDTGANLATCSRSNPNGCDPVQFRDPGGLQAMIAFARQRNETLVRVHSIEEAFDIIEGKRAVSPSQILTSTSGGGSSLLAAIPILGLLYSFATKGR